MTPHLRLIILSTLLILTAVPGLRPLEPIP